MKNIPPPTSPFTNPLIKQILKHYKTLWALNHMQGVAYWDMNTYMPKKGVKARGEAFAKMSSLYQQISLDPEYIGQIKEAAQEKTLNDYEKAVIRVLKREIDIMEKLPKEFLEELEKVKSESIVIWEKAKKDNDFKTFQPHLTKIVDMTIQKAEYLGYKESIYDPLMDLYEEGWTEKEASKYFDTIKQPLKELLSYIVKSPKYKTSHPFENTPYDLNRLKEINKKVLTIFRYNPESLRVDESAHPFSTNFSVNDARITTRYKEKDFTYAITGTSHEFGHALYSMQVNPNLDMTPIGDPISLVIHESQSRFWENIIFRSPEFLEQIVLDLQQLSPNFKKYNAADFVSALNLVRPSLIRTEADEVTYHFHVMLRFELEKALVKGEIKVADLPDVWAAKIKEYLGVSPKTDTEGVLQDIHWSKGSIGYFPTYSMGTFLSGMWLEKIEEELGDIHRLISKPGEGIEKIQNWLKTNVHTFGSTYTLSELINRQLGKEFSPEPMLKYLNKKYRAIY